MEPPPTAQAIAEAPEAVAETAPEASEVAAPEASPTAAPDIAPDTAIGAAVGAATGEAPGLDQAEEEGTEGEDDFQSSAKTESTLIDDFARKKGLSSFSDEQVCACPR